ncbi:MAG: putative zinc-binding metallopeptidase [Planctomycetota bacterium]
MSGSRRSRASRRAATTDWASYTDGQLLDLRLCDLGLELEQTPAQALVEELWSEFAGRGLRFRPYVWISTEWFTPDDTTGFAIPFYVVHPRLVRLERRQMLEVEGGTREDCLKLMRHEAAHALDNAYRIRRSRRFREVFGSPSEPYDSSYAPDPNSRDHVLHLDYWYSQSHPLEDWAETFAVWLRPGSGWRRRYAGWPALRKLEYVDELCDGLAARAPKIRTRRREEPLSSVKLTLREYYERKRAAYTDDTTPVFAGRLERVFPRDGEGPPAAAFLRGAQRDLVRRVAAATGQHTYLVDHVLREMVARARDRKLRLAGDPADALVEAAVLLTSLSSHYSYGSHPRYQR